MDTKYKDRIAYIFYRGYKIKYVKKFTLRFCFSNRRVQLKTAQVEVLNGNFSLFNSILY